MPIVSDTISIAQLSLAMARVDTDKSAFRGRALDYLLPWKINTVKKAVQWAYDQSATYDNIQGTANFLYSLCDKWGVLATAALSIDTPVDGGPVVGVLAEVPVFPMKKTVVDFTTATFCPETRLYGNNLIVYVNQIPRYLEDYEYSVTVEGIYILFDGFDATADGAKWDIVIEKVYT